MLAGLLAWPGAVRAEDAGARPPAAAEVPGARDDDAPPEVPGWTPPTWQGSGSAPRGTSPTAPSPGLGTLTALPHTGWRVEGAAVVGSGDTFGVVRLQAAVAFNRDRALAVRVPLVLAPDLTAALATGNLAIDYQLRMGRGDAVEYAGAVSLLVPAATNPTRFLFVPGHERMNVGLEAAFGGFSASGRWRFHLEAVGGLYGDPLMPLRAGLTGLVAWHAVGPLEILAQADPSVVLLSLTDGRIEGPGTPQTEELEGRLGLAIGVALEAGPVQLRAAWQRIWPDPEDHRLWVGIASVLTR